MSNIDPQDVKFSRKIIKGTMHLFFSFKFEQFLNMSQNYTIFKIRQFL